MPTYEYACTACAERLEVVQSFTDSSLTECPACGGKLRKVFSPVGVVFKGSGFYKTDSRQKTGSSAGKGEGAAASGGSDGGKSGDGSSDAGGSAGKSEPGKSDSGKSDAGKSGAPAASSSATTPAAAPSPSGSGAKTG